MKKTIVIEGMSCMHCVGAVKNALSEIEGVISVNVDLAAKTATVDVEDVSDTVLKDAIEEAGYDVIEIK